MKAIDRLAVMVERKPMPSASSLINHPVTIRSYINEWHTRHGDWLADCRFPRPPVAEIFEARQRLWKALTPNVPNDRPA